MEKAGCRGSKISDRQFVMIPTIGMFQNEANTLSAYGALEFNFNITFSKGLTMQFLVHPVMPKCYQVMKLSAVTIMPIAV